MLTTEQKAITNSKIISGSRNPADWVLFLNNFLFEYNIQFAIREKQIRKTTLASRSSWITSVVVVYLIIITGFWWLMLLILPPLSWFLLRKYQENGEIPHRVTVVPKIKENLEFLIPVIYLLSQETKKEALITIFFDLNNIFINVGARKNNKIATKNGKDYNFNEYEMDFLTLKTNFSDKTTIQLTIQNKIKETFITKKSKKGRLKRSVKRMNQTIYKANVGFSKLQYQAKPNVAFTEKKEKYWLTSQTDTISEENLTGNILNAKDLIQYNSKHLWSEIAKTYAKMNVIK